MLLWIGDKTTARKSSALAICLLGILLGLVLITSSLPFIFAHADVEESTGADDIATTTVTFVLDGDATITIEGDHGSAALTIENPELTLEITTGTSVHLAGSLHEANDVSVSSRYMYGYFNIEDTDTYEQVSSFEKDVTAAGVDKVVTVSVGDSANTEALAKAASLLSNGISVLSVSSPTVGETFTGTSTITTVNQPNGTGTTVVDVTITPTSGILTEADSLVVYCADRGSAAPVVGVTYNYTATVLSVNQTSGEVELSVYLEGEWPYNYAWGNYQRLSGSTILYRTYTGDIDLQKASSNAAISSNNGAYSLEGAVYGVYSSYANAESDTSAVATMTTNTSGYARATELSAGTYYVKEITAPAGYALDESIYAVTVTAGSTTSVNGGTVYDIPQNNPAGVLLQKVDSETGTAQGSASLAGAEYVVEYYDAYYDMAEGARASGNATRTWVLTTDEDGSVLLAADYLIDASSDGAITSDSLYHNTTGLETLPLGTYIIYEYKASEGYLLSDEVYLTQVTSDGTTESVDTYSAPTGDAALQEQVIRGDIEFSKKDQTSGTAMAGIPFRITSETTGESHIIVTDQNGYASTASSWNPHSYKTNANDAASDGSYDASYGLWFGDTSAMDDSVGALPYDTYTIEELACEANEGRQLIIQTGVVISRNNRTVNLGTIDDPTAAITSEAVDSADGDQIVVAGFSTSITDYVYYYNLIPGKEYTLEGVLMLTDTGEEFTLNGNAVTASVTFIPTSTTSVVEVVFDLNETISVLPENELNVTITVFEKLYSDGRLIAAHEELDDTLQQIKIVVPEIETQAFDVDDDDQYVETGDYDKTGGNLSPIFTAILALAAVGIGATAYGIHRQRRSAHETARKASQSAYRVFNPSLCESSANGRYQQDRAHHPSPLHKRNK